jgi:hypothetical protein
MSRKNAIMRSEGELSPEDYLYKPDERPFGKTYQEWTADWWNWLVGIQKKINPANDPSGNYGKKNQPSKDVWFLAGEVKGKAKRQARIPSDRAILFPVVNFEWSYFEMLGFAGDNAQQILSGSAGQNAPTITAPQKRDLKEFTEDYLDDMYSLDAVIDEGTKKELRLYTGELCKYRVATDLDITFVKDNVFNTHTGSTEAYSDGYWMFLKEGIFKKGEKHTIWFRGVTEYYQTEVTYNITFT